MKKNQYMIMLNNYSNMDAFPALLIKTDNVFIIIVYLFTHSITAMHY